MSSSESPLPPSPPTPPSPQRPQADLTAARQALLRMVVLVVVIDAVAIAIYKMAHIEQATQRVQEGFTVAWIVLGLLVVMTQLRRIRVARYGSRRPRR